MRNIALFSERLDHGSGSSKGILRPERKRIARLSQRSLLLVCILVAFGISGCATSVGVKKNDPRESYAEITASAVSADDYSRFSRDVLIRYNLVKAFKKNPRQVLIFLHHEAGKDYRNDLLFAMAELNYFIGMRYRQNGIGKSRPHFFASVLYAYFYLLGKEWLGSPDPFDRRFRIACDLYNGSLAEALADSKGNLRIAPAEVKLPVGSLNFSLDTRKFHHEIKQFENFVSTDRFGIRGLTRRNRESGLGAPIIAVEKKPAEAPMYRTSPGALFLRFNCRFKDIEEGACTGTLELYSAYNDTEIEVGDNIIPLERDVTVQLAYTIDQPYIQSLGFNEFLHGTGYIKTGLYPMQPYEPDKIPIVLVHGTFSSPVAWAEMANTLCADPIIARKYQIWNFFYDTGKRLGISAQELRGALNTLVDQMDPEGAHTALHQMVVIGHSQGGLLTKLTAADTGDAFVRLATGKSIAELDVSDEDRARIEKETVFKSLPFVSRVVFISTPHRGSFLSKNWVRTLILKIITLPLTVVQSTGNLLETLAHAGVSDALSRQLVNMTSLDVMSTNSPILQTLADIPLAQGIKGHSIIAINGDEIPPDGDDGVVRYTSAHVDYVESEFLVRYGHSCQSHPLVIEEVRRILLEHLKEHQLFPDQMR